MKPHVARLSIACTIVICVAGICVYAQGRDDTQLLDGNAKQLLSPKKEQRERSLEKLSAQYLATSKELERALNQAARKQKGDRGYLSPLHCAIQAVRTWRVLKADELLLSIVDYELDRTSLPLGMLVFGDYFYPAASALIPLRVDTGLVLKAIETSKNKQRLRVLTWVLYKRVGDAGEARVMLKDAEKARSGNKKANLKEAMRFLERPSKILPHPGNKGGSNK